MGAGWAARLKAWAAALRRDGVVLWFALRHPATPRSVKWLAWLVVAYALSPIDLVPDFIPVLGYVDDLLLLPGLIWLALRLLPPAVLADSRERAAQWLAERRNRPVSRVGLVLVLLLWTGLAWALWQTWGAG